ncbi:MAG: M20/M25/M40 family metallo-hydrolase [Proteobacteria bacterium]|nr:M20/M25/M40 family metallo-hydrolase [Pseudomonadota bacterium]
MLNKSTNYINLISILIIVYLAFIPLKPSDTRIDSIIDGRFLLVNALEHVKKISRHPRYVGTYPHKRAGTYIIKQLQAMGLQVKIQKTNSVNRQKRIYAPVENIFAVIKGSDATRKSLLLMSHYDSAPFNSYGAADAASGVAVILEGVRAFLDKNIQPINDIVILFTDAEEIGLMGAKAFVNKHKLANNVGVVLNFEARGSAGSAYMFMETNSGNHNLLQAFKTAGIQIANSNSMAYSIYKMLPNDTDLTVLRQDKDIAGFNFAFIDKHFNYHTVLDNLNNLSLDSLAHQAGYLMPLLDKLSHDDLSLLTSDADDVYFQLPFWKTVSYPFAWAIIISLVNLFIFAIIVIYGIRNKSLQTHTIFAASLPLFKSLVVTALLSFVILKFLYYLHPQYAEILQGFPYNGHRYIIFFSLLAVSTCFVLYKSVQNKFSATNLLVMPIFIWIIISIACAVFLTGAHFFVIIGLLGTLALAVCVVTNKPQPTAILFLSMPVILIFAPFFMQLPVAMGIAILPFSGILLVLVLATFITSIQIPGFFQISKWLLIFSLVATFTWAKLTASTSSARPLPNSLFYLQDQESSDAYFFSTDHQSSDWNKDILDSAPLDIEEVIGFKNSYWQRAKIVSETQNRNIEVANIEVVKQRKYFDRKVYTLQITLVRKVDVMYIKTNTELNVFKLAINQEIITTGTATKLQPKKSQLVSIFPAGQTQFTLDIEVAPDETLDLNIFEISHDLLRSKKFDIPARTSEFIPKPFVYSDSIITTQKVLF